jgi:hypothetical protein
MRVKKDSLIDRRMDRKFGGERRRYSPKVIAGAVLLLAVPLVATSLASNVVIKGAQGGAIEFGQGHQVTIGCDLSIQTAVGESWNSTLNGGQGDFIVSTINLTGLNNDNTYEASTVSNQGCGGKTLKVALYNLDNAQTPISSTDNSKVAAIVVPADDGAISSIIGSGGTGTTTALTGQILNTSEGTITGVQVNSPSAGQITYTYTAGTDAPTYPLIAKNTGSGIDGSWVTISGITTTGATACNLVNQNVTAVSSTSLTAGSSYTFTITPSAIPSGCTTTTGINAGNKIRGNSTVILSLQGTNPVGSGINVLANTISRASIESQ